MLSTLRHILFGPSYPPKYYREVKVGPAAKNDLSYSYYHSQYASNIITTAKYNLVTFVPRALFEQFRRVANLYFLLISILMLIGTYTNLYSTPLAPWSTLFPLLVVLAITMMKEGLEDIKRHSADAITNNKTALRLLPSANSNISASLSHEVVSWQDIEVGDLLLLHNNDDLPADLLLLYCANSGCYIETSNIDGETNLKLKTAARGLGISSIEHCRSLDLVLQCEHPNSAIHHFNGTLASPDTETGVDSTSFLLRGSTLRNTSAIVGLVVYTGRDTKLVRNSRATPSKLSSIEKTMNNLIYLIFSAQVLISVTTLICYVLWKSYYRKQLGYLCFNYQNSANYRYRSLCEANDEYGDSGYFFTFFILYNNFLPISLYVTVELCNYIQAYYIDCDINMYDSASNMPSIARTSNMNGDLGMVEYIFSDKTGTLTDNCMIFQQCSVAGVVYSVQENPSEGILSMNQLAEQSIESNDVHEFLLVMCAAHTIIIDPVSKEWQAESPDELALVQGAAQVGYRYIGREDDIILIERNDKELLRLEVLATIPFDSTRKRMTVILRLPDNKIVALVKGADNIMFERAASFHATISQAKLLHHLNHFAVDGLRTLVIGRKYLTEEQFNVFANQWNAADKALVGRKELYRQAATLIESELDIIGATAIEDKLQEDVPATISTLRDAGIKLWVLTGDKVETAINIGYSCHLLMPKMILIRMYDHVKYSTTDIIKKKVSKLIDYFTQLHAAADAAEANRIWSNMRNVLRKRSNSGVSLQDIDGSVHSSFSDVASDAGNTLPTPLLVSASSSSQSAAICEHLALIVDGDTLLKIFGDSAAEKLFFRLAKLCNVVLACRVSPEQKRLMVRLVKKHTSAITLSIGDGANDVSMIQEAQIGVGISGKEGQQAVNASDFAIPKFRYLKQLLLLHGRKDYRRISKVVLYSFYKNITLTLLLFLYTFYSGYSGQSIFDDYIYAVYNFILALPVLSFGIFDVDISDTTLLKYPALYTSGINRADMNVSVLLRQLLQATIDALLLFYLPYGCFKYSVQSDGRNDGIWVMGSTIYCCMLVAMFVRCALITHTWTKWSVIFFFGSIGLFLAFIFTYQAILYFYNFYGVASVMFAEPLFWLLILLVPACCAVVEIAVSTAQRMWYPSFTDLCIEHDRGCVDGFDFTALYRNLVLKLQQMPLDWLAVDAIYSNMANDDKDSLALYNTADGPAMSAYNYDHVATQYGPGAGFVFISSSLQRVSQAVFGKSTLRK